MSEKFYPEILTASFLFIHSLRWKVIGQYRVPNHSEAFTNWFLK